MAVSPLAYVVSLGVLVLLVLVTRHAARGGLFTALLFPLVLWFAGLRGVTTWISVPTGLVLALRYLVDWNRQYRELWLDREKQT